jgi:methionine aminotransferase
MVLSRGDVHALATVLQETDAVVISDEVYEHIVFDGLQHESLARYPEIADRAVVISSFGKTYHATGWKIGYCAAPAALSTEVARVHQFVTYAVNGAIQRAYAEMVEHDPLCAGLAPFYQEKRDLFLRLMEGSRFTPLACQGTFFQMMDYSAISRERDSEFALWLIKEHGVAGIPITPFLHGVDAGLVIRFCFAKRTDTLERAAERLREV